MQLATNCRYDSRGEFTTLAAFRRTPSKSNHPRHGGVVSECSALVRVGVGAEVTLVGWSDSPLRVFNVAEASARSIGCPLWADRSLIG
jgi:hypothetical protein